MKPEEELYQAGFEGVKGLGLVGDPVGVQTFLLSADYYSEWLGGSIGIETYAPNHPIYIVIIDGNYQNVRVSSLMAHPDLKFVGAEATFDAVTGRLIGWAAYPSYGRKPDYNVIPDYEALRRANEAAQAQQIAPEATAEALLDLPAAP